MRVRLIAMTQVVDYIPDYQPHPGIHDHPPTDADDLAEQAGRLCYVSWNRPNPATATNEGYVANIVRQQHFSVLEHASATFYIDGVTRNLTHELIRHRHLSFSEVSQRYVNVRDFEFVRHPALRNLDYWSNRGINEVLGKARETYEDVYAELTQGGANRKQARQAARHVLPSGTETKILVTGNHRTWREVLAKRLARNPETGECLADLEFVELAKCILLKLKQVAPAIYQDFEVPA